MELVVRGFLAVRPYPIIPPSGGSAESAPFKRFVELVVRGFLAVRPYCEAVCTLVSLMMDTNLPCFRDNALRKLRNRYNIDIRL